MEQVKCFEQQKFTNGTPYNNDKKCRKKTSINYCPSKWHCEQLLFVDEPPDLAKQVETRSKPSTTWSLPFWLLPIFLSALFFIVYKQHPPADVGSS